jgi:hypothetical protein
MTGSPGKVEGKQLEELGIEVKGPGSRGTGEPGK